MGRTEGKKFHGYKDENPSKAMFFPDPLLEKRKKTEAGGNAQISDFIYGVFATVSVLRGTRWVTWCI